ncbi:MAG: class I SAM-dependent methyltransferase [Terriglobia bacterium]
MSLKTFGAEVLADFQTTAAIAPSSRYLIRAMLEPLPLDQASIVVEFGAGTGVMTQALLDRLPQHATLLAFEINPRLFRYLKGNLPDPRLLLFNASAETLGQELRRRGCQRVDAAVSSLGLTLMSEQQRRDVLCELVPFLDQKSVFTQFQYIHGQLVYFRFKDGRAVRFSSGRLLRQYFASVQRKIIWRNLPPAFVFTCYR